jgi:hypothetical protein
MNLEPRHQGDYTDRQVDAARRVLVDVGQVLDSFRDAMVVVGGWVPDLLFPCDDLKTAWTTGGRRNETARLDATGRRVAG